jgi:hypothetical protein
MRPLFVVMAALAGCAAPPEPSTPPPPVRVEPASYPSHTALWADPAQHDFSDNPGLLERIMRSPHGYYRFINRRFSQAVCRRFRDLLSGMPTVNLHGDAHLEQVAITTRTRGLVDFDDATTGPPVLDLVRFGVSIYLTARQHAWLQMAPAFYEAFLDGYQTALTDPGASVPEPRLVTRLREQHPPPTPAEFLQRSTKLMKPLDPALEARVRAALNESFARMRRPDGLSASAFAIKEVGGFGLGIGSALSEKYLIRVEGPTPDPDDDLIFEAKELKHLGAVSCVDGGDRIDPVRTLAVRSRFAPVPERYLGYTRIDDRAFWMHDWQASYQELDAEGELGEPADFVEVLYDVGFQLGRGHPERIAAPRDAELRAELLRMLELRRGRLHHEVSVLHQQVIEAWQSFVQRVADEPTGGIPGPTPSLAP